MSGDRYEIEDAYPGIVGVKLGANTWYLDGEQPEAGAIRQQGRDIASRDAVIAACAEAVGASVSPGCSDEFRAMLPVEIRAKLANVIAEKDAWRRRAEESEPHLATGDKSQREIAANPGVSGLAQLGRNAIERVSELERELAAVTAERDAANAYASDLNDSLIAANAESVALEAERDQLRARLAAIDNAPTVAWQDVYDSSDLYWRRPDPAQVATRELIARPAKE